MSMALKRLPAVDGRRLRLYRDGFSQPQVGYDMPTHQVNLDALIKREDFEAGVEGATRKRVGNEIRLPDLERAYFHLLRKPDFQRETCSWSPERICDLVKSFVDGDLIPSIILWWSSQNGTLFVIDGAHRLSALLAWVHDDYGDGRYSNEFWGTAISPEQRRLAKATKQLIENEIGAYHKLKWVLENPDQSHDELTLLRARNAASFKIDSQWVEGTAATAEESFFRINGSSTVIDHTELGIIKARRKPTTPRQR